MMPLMGAILILFLSTLSLRRATQVFQRIAKPFRISIHALLAESDNCRFHARTGRAISIHALLAESDHPRPPDGRPCKNFYPRSPCGERRGDGFPVVDVLPISIHALLAESDQ